MAAIESFAGMARSYDEAGFGPTQKTAAAPLRSPACPCLA